MTTLDEITDALEVFGFERTDSTAYGFFTVPYKCPILVQAVEGDLVSISQICAYCWTACVQTKEANLEIDAIVETALKFNTRTFCKSCRIHKSSVKSYEWSLVLKT